MKRSVALSLLVALLNPATLVAEVARPDPELAAGIGQVNAGDFEGALTTLDRVARRLEAQPAGAKERAQALLYLGIAYVALDQNEAARQRFREALALDGSLRLTPDRHSPKVIAVFEQARREPVAAAPGAAKRGGAKLPLLLVGAGAAAAGIAIAAGGGGAQTPPQGNVSFANARFATTVILCPNGSVDVPAGFSLLVDALNGRSTPLSISAASVTMSIANSPEVPSEVGFTSSRPSSAMPNVVPGSTSPSVQVDSTLLCNNTAGGPARFNDWSAVVTLTTSAGVFTLQTQEDRLRVNLP